MKRVSALALLLCLANIARAADSTPASLAARLAGDNQEDIAAALAAIQARLADEPNAAIGYVQNTWLPPLVDHHHYAEALTLLAAAIVALPQNTGEVANYQRQRIALLQRLARPDDALAAAKSLFNQCPMPATDEALLSLATCLNAARGVESPDAANLAEEQRAGFAHPSASPTLLAIHVDPAPFEPGIRRLYLPLHALPVAPVDLLGLGNLLLLADRPADALAAFQKLQTLVAQPDQLRNANDGVARALRAIDGTIGRANAFAARIAKT